MKDQKCFFPARITAVRFPHHNPHVQDDIEFVQSGDHHNQLRNQLLSAQQSISFRISNFDWLRIWRLDEACCSVGFSVKHFGQA